MMTGVNLVHVPIAASAFASPICWADRCRSSFAAMHRSRLNTSRPGKLRALAVTTAARSAALPDMPTVGEFVPGYEASGWFGLGAPRNTPAEIIDMLNKEINAALADPKMKARLADLGGLRLRVRRPTSASSSPTKPRNGPR